MFIRIHYIPFYNVCLFYFRLHAIKAKKQESNRMLMMNTVPAGNASINDKHVVIIKQL